MFNLIGGNMDYDDILQDAFENYEDEHRFDEEGQLEYLEDNELEHKY
jgi:hypothetical protein